MVGFGTVSPLGTYDGSGRLIRRLCVGNRLSGEYEVVWDRLDEKGNPVAPGDYQWRLANSASIKAQYVRCDAPPACPQLGRAYQRVWEVDPLKCNKCGGQMRTISFPDGSGLYGIEAQPEEVIRQILAHYGFWQVNHTDRQVRCLEVGCGQPFPLQ